MQVSGLELGGLAGSLSSGAISDYLVRNNDGSKGNVGLRVQVLNFPLRMSYVFAAPQSPSVACSSLRIMLQISQDPMKLDVVVKSAGTRRYL